MRPGLTRLLPFTIEMSIPPLPWLGSKTETLTMRHSRPQAPNIAIATLFLVTAMVPSVAFGSKFSECKSSALTHYSAAVLEANPDNAKRAIIESTACDRFISELPREEQEKIRRFQEEMQKFQLDQSRIQNKT